MEARRSRSSSRGDAGGRGLHKSAYRGQRQSACAELTGPSLETINGHGPHGPDKAERAPLVSRDLLQSCELRLDLGANGGFIDHEIHTPAPSDGRRRGARARVNIEQAVTRESLQDPAHLVCGGGEAFS